LKLIIKEFFLPDSSPVVSENENSLQEKNNSQKRRMKDQTENPVFINSDFHIHNGVEN